MTVAQLGAVVNDNTALRAAASDQAGEGQRASL